MCMWNHEPVVVVVVEGPTGSAGPGGTATHVCSGRRCGDTQSSGVGRAGQTYIATVPPCHGATGAERNAAGQQSSNNRR